MDRETIYLDNDEEITSVVDKMKNANTGALDLVIPKDALLLQSVVNLKLLKKQAEGLGKEITIVTQDKVGRKLAEQIGIPVVEKEGEIPKEVKMSESDEPKVSEDDIELKESSSAEQSLSDDGGLGKGVTEGAIIPPADEIVAGESVKPEVEMPAESNSAKASLDDPSKDKKKKGRKWKKWAILSGFVGLAVAVAAYIYVPLANVTIKLAAEKKKVDVSFTADKSNSGVDTGSQTIPARIISEDKESSSKYQTTGKKKVGEKSKGTVTIYNEYQTDPLTIVAGTRLSTAGGLIFKTASNITVPGFTMPGGVMNPGKVDVLAEADQVGDNYNVASGTQFSVPAIGSNKVYAKATSGMSGGTSRDVSFVTQTDINSAKEDMKKNMEQEMKRLALEKAEREERLLDEALKITEVSAASSVAVNGEAAEFNMTVKLNVKALVFKDEDLKKLAESVLADQIGSTKEIVEKESLTSSTEFTDADFEKGQMHARLSGEAFIAAKLDQNKIKVELTGDPEYKAVEYLKGQDGVDDAEIKFFPGFYKRMPRIKDHIYIKTSVSKVQSE